MKLIDSIRLICITLETLFVIAVIVWVIQVFRNRKKNEKLSGKKPTFSSEEVYSLISQCENSDELSRLTEFLNAEIDRYPSSTWSLFRVMVTVKQKTLNV